MSKKKRAIAKQKKQNSEAARRKRARKAYYVSPAAKINGMKNRLESSRVKMTWQIKN